MKYFERLDGLRAFAVGAVMVSHWVPSQYLFGIPLGKFGVQLFFVMSGFLITRILRKARSETLAKGLLIFYWRRFIRIFPLYYFCLLWISILGWGMGFEADSLWHWTYLSNWKFWLDGNWGGPVSHFWSLAVEEQFYLLWPLIFLKSGRDEIGLRMAISLVLIGVVYRLWALNSSISEAFLWDFLTPACLESLGFGAILAHTWEWKSTRFLGKSFLSLSALLLLIVFLTRLNVLSAEWRHHTFVLWCVVLIWLACRANRLLLDGVLLHPMIRYLGMISYGLYIWHNFMGFPWHWLAKAGGFPERLEFGFGAVVGKSLLTVLFATMTWYGFERPLLRLKNRFHYG